MHAKRSPFRTFTRKNLAAMFVCLMLLVGIGGTAAIAAGKTAAAPAAVGHYADGLTLVCVKNTTPYTVTGHAGARTKACPAGSTLGTWADRNAKTVPAPQFGVGRVDIARGSGAATTWSTFSTVLGGPAATAASTFRMSCSASQAPCTITAKALATVAGVKVYPRLLISKENFNSGAAEGNCEYADGVDNDGGSKAVGTSATALPLGVGGSLDCGSSQTLPASGVVDEIQVPSGRYNIAATYTFTLAS